MFNPVGFAPDSEISACKDILKCMLKLNLITFIKYTLLIKLNETYRFFKLKVLIINTILKSHAT